MPKEPTFFLYDHLGNTRVAFRYCIGNNAHPYTVVNAMDYYPYGKTLRVYDNGNGDRYLTTGHERDGETGLDYRGARYYDSDVARFLSTDPWANKYPQWSTYNYVMGNPISLVDPSGKGPTDWFVNKTTGTVIYIKGESTVTQAKLDEMGSTYKPSDYKRLGGDKMFGDDVSWGAGNGDILEKSFFALHYQSSNFMESYGYVKAKVVTVEEEEVYSGEPKGSDGGGHSHTSYSIKKTGDGGLTYCKRKELYEKDITSDTKVSGQYNYFRTVVYDMKIPIGGDYKKNPYFSDNKSANNTNSVLGVVASILDVILDNVH